MGQELLPCPKPWCGEPAALETFVCILRPGEHQDYSVVCQTCRCGTPVCCTKDEALALWNQRAGTPPVGDVAGLDAAAEEYAYNPDTPHSQSGINGETAVDPEEAFKAGARWFAAHRAPPDGEIGALVAELEAAFAAPCASYKENAFITVKVPIARKIIDALRARGDKPEEGL
jgi:hypothetical protein